MSFEKVIEQATLFADGLVIRPLQHSDVELLEMYASDERVARNTSTIPHPYPPGAAQSYVERGLAKDRTEDVWIIDNTEDRDTVLGVISLERLDREQSEVGYWVAPAMWNNGLASKAVEAIVAANPQASKTMFAAVFQDNPASSKVLTHAGFDYIGDAETFCVARDAVVPTWTYLRKMD